MPRSSAIPLPRISQWLKSIRNQSNSMIGVNIEYLRHKYNNDNCCNVKVKGFTSAMNKAAELLDFINMKSERNRLNPNYDRKYYFTPSSEPGDIPTTTYPIKRSSRRTSKFTKQPQGPNSVTPDRTSVKTKISRVNVTQSTQNFQLPDNPEVAMSPLTLLSRAASCLDSIDTPSPTIISQQQQLPSPSFVLPSFPTRSSFTSIAQLYIHNSHKLCFDTHPRPDPRYIPSNTSTPGTINHIHNITRLPPEMKLYMVMQAKHYGLEKLSKHNKAILMEAILITESYLEGYPIKMGSIRSFKRWHEELKKKEMGSASLRTIQDMFRDRSGNCTIPFTTKIQQLYPELLHSLFRYAGNTHGYDANTSILVSSMNDKSKALYPNCPVRGKLELSKYNFTRFFKENKGIIKQPTTKPRLTDNHKKSRVVFSKTNKRRLHKKRSKGAKHVSFNYCFIDEKWFYIFTNRKKTKYLPGAKFEKLSDVIQPARKIRSRRYVTKVMFMGIVAPPSFEHNFDGKIMLKRVSRQTKTKKLTHHQHFSVNYHVNQLIKDGEWKEACFLPGMVGWELFETLQDTYDLEDDIVFSLVLTYRTFTTDKTKTIKVVRINRASNLVINDIDIRTKEGGPIRKIHLDDLTLHVRAERGSVAETDVNCDTDFMLESIDEVGSAIRDKMKWVPKTDPIYLFIDNAGGHGTDEGKCKYEEILKDKYNVILEWQVPNSPETNMLDLGAWMSIQSVVEELHRQRLMNEDALADTVMQAFEEFDGPTKLAAIAARWELVLDLILEDKGGNDLVETKRGTLTKTLNGKRLPNSDIYNQERIPLVVDDSDDECANAQSGELI